MSGNRDSKGFETALSKGLRVWERPALRRLEAREALQNNGPSMDNMGGQS
jgi:hypothetical protein